MTTGTNFSVFLKMCSYFLHSSKVKCQNPKSDIETKKKKK